VNIHPVNFDFATKVSSLQELGKPKPYLRKEDLPN
jgi:hypothetical protein